MTDRGHIKQSDRIRITTDLEDEIRAELAADVDDDSDLSWRDGYRAALRWVLARAGVPER